MKKWETLDSKTDYTNPYFKVLKDRVKNSSQELDYYYLDRNKFGVAIGIINNCFVMVNQYRYPIRRESLEFPMGGIDEGENLEDCARREMAEEAGFLPGKLTFLGTVAPTPGHSKQLFSVYLAEDLEKTEAHQQDETEELEVEMVKIKDFDKLVRKGRISDGPTITAYAFYLMHEREKQQGGNH